MKRFFRSEAWLVIRVMIVFLLIAVGIVFAFTYIYDMASAEDAATEVWVLCDPESFVCVRDCPRKTSYAFGGATCGTMLKTDGKQAKGYVHVVDVAAESDTGWISANYIVYDEPVRIDQYATVVSNGRLAVRNGVGGKLKRWLKPMDTVRVIYWSEEWCLTAAGYVQTMFLELDGEY